MRRLISFDCAGETLFGTLDEAEGTTGLLIVSGGNEIRVGAHRGMAVLAARLAASGVPVFRFDRRGVGDSSGVNGGYAQSRPDLAAAAGTFRGLMPQLTVLAGFGICDAATALLLYGDALFDRLILANPWLGGDEDGLPSSAAIKARYAEKVRDPGSWLRLATGRVNIGKLAGGVAKAAASSAEGTTDFERSVFRALRSHGDARVILAEHDATAIGFADAARRIGYAGRTDVIDTASHSFARPDDADALFNLVRAALD